MVPKSIKEREELKITWEDRNQIRLNYEDEIRMCFQKKLSEGLEIVKSDFENIFSE